jgi:hypothetical protein
MKELFELIDTYAVESHLRRYLLKCRECGQLYFFEFYEWIDWEHGNDPQYSKHIPVSTVEEALELQKASQAGATSVLAFIEHRFSQGCRRAYDSIGRPNVPPDRLAFSSDERY